MQQFQLSWSRPFTIDVGEDACLTGLFPLCPRNTTITTSDLNCTPLAHPYLPPKIVHKHCSLGTATQNFGGQIRCIHGALTGSCSKEQQASGFVYVFDQAKCTDYALLKSSGVFRTLHLLYINHGVNCRRTLEILRILFAFLPAN